MERKMRRFGQQLSDLETVAILERASSGVLAVLDADGYPYAVPMSYVYDEGRILFHCANVGHKLDAILHCDKASFCVVDQDRVIPEKYTTSYRSAIAFGRVRILADENEKREAASLLGAKYRPGFMDARMRHIEDALNRMCVVELAIERVTGKEGLELLKERRAAAQN